MTGTTRSLTLAEEPAAIADEPVDPMLVRAAQVAASFAVPEPIEARHFPEKGNINHHTYLILAGPPGEQRQYLLQCINHQVFVQPRHVMAAMLASIHAQRGYLARRPLSHGEEWEVITLVPTRQGNDYLDVEGEPEPTVWRLMERIPDAVTYKSLGEIQDASRRLDVAYEAGRGLAMYGDFTSGMDTSPLASPLPGYRNTRLYYDQFLSVLQECRTVEEAAPYLPEDPVVREGTWRHFLLRAGPEECLRRREDPEVEPLIALAGEQMALGMALLLALEGGAIRTVAIHGDTKLDNFLFSAHTGRVKALVDLDTIMPHTWLADWGDMVRSLVNVAGEKEEDPGRVDVDLGIFEAIAEGFLSTAREVTAAEVGLMVEAVQVIALELGVRFLADYLRGDTYFGLSPGDPPHLNKTRALVQLTLFRRLQEKAEAMKACIGDILIARG